MRSWISITVVVSLLLSSGCGALFNRSERTIPINVDPPGAEVYVDGMFVGQAPLEVSLEQDRDHNIEVRAQGFQSTSKTIRSEASGGYIALDCALLVFAVVPGVIALAVDASSNSWNTLEPEHVSIKMAPERSSKAASLQPKAPQAGCYTDMDCKGDRICNQGQCQEPR